MMEPITVPSYFVDENKKLRLTAFMEYAQQAGEISCEEDGFGVYDMLKHDCAWVIAHYHIIVRRMPSLGEQVIAKSWPTGIFGPLFRRDYSLTTPQGETLVLANSTSCIMDLSTRTIRRPDSMDFDLSKVRTDYAIEDLPERLHIDRNAVPEESIKRKAVWSDIDYNHHVNNVRYIQWALDFLTDEDLEAGVNDITVNYNHEVPKGAEVELRRYRYNSRIWIEGLFEGMSAFLISILAEK